MPEVSVIVPVYNAEKYLARCIDSILAQTFKDFELILVDDGSTDSGGGICDSYSLRDQRVKEIHKENGGVSSARNAGLYASSGNWIMFCDSDDVVKPDWIKVLLDMANEYPNMLVGCQFSNITIEGNEKITQLDGIKDVTFLNKNDYYRVWMAGYSHSSCIRIFNADIIKRNGLCFDSNMKISEDVIFICEYLKYVDYKMIYIPKCCYQWIDNNGKSLSRTYNPKYYDLLKKLYYVRKQIINESQITDYCNNEFWRFYNLCIVDTFEKSDRTQKEKYQYINEILNDKVFIDALNNADDGACDKRLRFVLGLKNARLLFAYRNLLFYYGKIKNSPKRNKESFLE